MVKEVDNRTKAVVESNADSTDVGITDQYSGRHEQTERQRSYQNCLCGILASVHRQSNTANISTTFSALVLKLRN